MSFNILVTVCIDDEWIEILHNLEQKCDWQIRYMVGFPEMEKIIRNSFKGVLFEPVSHFLEGLECFSLRISESNEISDLPEKKFEFDLLEKLSKYEFMAKYIINREFEKGSDRTNEIYFDLINYWLKILDFTKPCLIIVPWTPYTSREYILFALSQILDIRFLSFRRTTIGNYLNIPFSNPHNPVINELIIKYEHLKAMSSSPLKVTNYALQMSAMQRVQEISNLNSKNILENSQKKIKSDVNFNKFDFIRDYFLNYLIGFKHGVKVQFPNFFLNKLRLLKSIKYLYHSIRAFPKKNLAELNGLMYKIREIKKFKTLKMIYDTYCIEPDFNRPYIFFTLHYQPEQTTAPFGNYAIYQYLPIEMIARSLPNNWVIYVKEHYTTFSPFYGGLKKRTKEYYEKISKIPNVFLIPIETESAILIDHSKAVATITGSIGPEAILRGKPVLTFGSAWYNGCEGVFLIQEHKECKKAIEKIRQGINIDPNQMLLFIQAAEAVGAKVNYSFSMKNAGDESISREETIMNMTECILNWWGNENH